MNFRLIQVHKYRCYFHFLFLRVLALMFKIDSWHCIGNYHCRPYKRIIVDKINQLRLDTAIEVGCGLGDIITRLKIRNRIGFDTDDRVLKLARLLSVNNNIHFYKGGVMDIQLNNFDIFIGVNWMHGVEPSQVDLFIQFLQSKCRYVLVDKIDKNATETYEYKHDFNRLYKIALSYEEFRVSGEPRTFLLFKLH